jgi:hypothetical protein
MAQTIMRAPELAPGTFNRPITAPSGVTYAVDQKGQVVVSQADATWFQSMGFSGVAPFGASVLCQSGVQTGAANLLIGTLPPNTFVQHVIVQNSTANATTGTIIGSVSGGSDIVAAAVIPGTNAPQDMTLLAHAFAAQTPIWLGASNWNSANLAVTIIWGYF